MQEERDLDVLRPLSNVNVGLTDEIEELLDGLWCVEVVANRLPDSLLLLKEGSLEAFVCLCPLLLSFLDIALPQDGLGILEELGETLVLGDSLSERVLPCEVH